jgi:hypothetical protein
MKLLFSLLFIVACSLCTLFAQSEPSPPAAAENIQQSHSNAAALTNQDLIELLQAGLTAEEMITKIKTSPANFDTSDAGLRALKDAGLPNVVIEAMLRTKNATSPKTVGDLDRQSTPQQIVLPAGTHLDVEARYTVSSLDVRVGDLISFRVLVPIIVDGFIVIDKDALVTARVVEAKRGGHWGKAGRLSWTMQDVLAVDGTRVPLRPANEAGSDKLGMNKEGDKRSDGTAANSVKGTSHKGEVITKAVIPGVLFPPLAPLGLIQGFKRGENAVLPEGKRFLAFVGSNATVTVTSRH